jgi:hypothetical protein
MSASICYRPVDPKPKTIGAYAPSSFMEAMERAGMQLPCTIGKGAIPVLSGMSATWGKGADSPNPYQNVIDAIEKYGDIELWAEY